MKLSEKQRRHLRGLAHPLQPVVMIGNSGLSDGVVAETARALHDHELIKVKLAFEEREDKQEAITQLVKTTRAELVQQVGKIALIYRLARETNKKLSNLHRVF